MYGWTEFFLLFPVLTTSRLVFVIWVIRRELATFVKLRHQFLISRSHSKLAQARTVLITNLPDSVQTEQDLLKMLTYAILSLTDICLHL